MSRDVPTELLREHIVAALYGQESYDVAAAAARCLDAGQFRIMSRVDKDDAVIGDSLEYVVEIEAEPGRFVTLATVHWSRLALTEQDRANELACIRAQNGGIPDDISSLLDLP